MHANALSPSPAMPAKPAQTGTTPSHPPSPTIARAAGWLAIFHALLFLVPLTVLGSAIGWPANLDMGAAHNLPLLRQAAASVTTGYSVYLLYSILFWPAVLLIARALAGRDALPPLLQLAVGFALLSTLARCLGIMRWLSVMPVLASQWAGADASGQAVLAVVYEGFNAYAGRLGEVLGVFLFAAISVGLLSLALWRQRVLPRWLAWLGAATTAGLGLLSLEVFGLDMGAFIAPFSLLYMLWMVCLGIMLIRRARG